MMRYRNPLAPPPPSPQVAESRAYRALSGSTKVLLLSLEIAIAEAGGAVASIDLDAACEASGMDRPALVAALDELAAAGFIVTAESGKSIALSSAWRQA